MTEPKHSPTPWACDQQDERLTAHAVYDGVDNVVAEVRSHTDAAHIVLAVNSHDALVAALESVALRNGEDGPCFCAIRIPAGDAHHLSCQNARAILRKVKP